MAATWMVQATVNEPLPLIVAFVAHYLDMGADLVHLHLDDPHPEVRAVFGNNPKVRLTLCDAAYWRKMRPRRGRPLGHPDRQMVNARHTYQRMECDWLLCCDADEFVACDGDLGEFLASQPSYVDFVRLRVAEKVIPPGLEPSSVFEGVFRLPQAGGEDLAAEIYGPALAPMLERIVAGHDLGKFFIRRGGDFEIRHHVPMAREAEPGYSKPPEPIGIWLPGVLLAHYDALTPLHYFIKLLIKNLANADIRQAGRQPGLRHGSREAQMELAASACSSPDPVAMTRVLHQLTPESYAALERHGLLKHLPLRPDRTAQRLFPNLALDFTPKSFDVALRRKHARVLNALNIQGSASALPASRLGIFLSNVLGVSTTKKIGRVIRKYIRPAR